MTYNATQEDFYCGIHVLLDVFPCPYVYNEMDTINGSVGKNVRVLFSQAPQLEGNVQRQMEESFWRRVSRDTLKKYSWYSITYYRESESLTLAFK